MPSVDPCGHGAAVLACAAPAAARTYTGRLMQLRLGLGEQRERMAAGVKRRKRVRDVSIQRRLHGRGLQPADRPDATADSATPPTRSTRHRERASPQIRWAGRAARANCDWGAFMRAMPSRATVLGLPNGQYCNQDDIDFTNAPFTYNVPPGTTRLEQMVQCAAPTCSPGAAMHSHILEVTIDDPQPPSISLSGRMVSGRVGERRLANVPDVEVAARTAAEFRQSRPPSRRSTPGQSYGCNWSLTQPCPTHAAMNLARASPSSLMAVTHCEVSAVDAAGNISHRLSGRLVDNTPPDPVVPEVAGGGDWRRTNDFSVSWTDHPIVQRPSRGSIGRFV